METMEELKKYIESLLKEETDAESFVEYISLQSKHPEGVEITGEGYGDWSKKFHIRNKDAAYECIAHIEGHDDIGAYGVLDSMVAIPLANFGVFNANT